MYPRFIDRFNLKRAVEPSTLFGFGFQGFWFLVSGFQGFWFLGFIQIGVGIAIAIGIDHLTTEHFLGFQGFRVSGFQGFIQIGVGIAIAIGIDHLTAEHFLGFQGFRVSRFQGFKVSRFHGFKVSWFHPNRDRDRYRYRYRYRRPATRDIRPATIDRDARVSDTAGRFSRFQGFRVSSKSGSGSLSLSGSII